MKTENPAVSIIIPAYNVVRFISETLDSVFAQTFENYEVIVINDGSRDSIELERILNPYLERICYLKQENHGAGAARNTGLRAARGKYIAFLDADDVWLPDYLEKQVSFIESDGGYDLVYCDALLIGDSPWAGKAYMERDPSNGPVTLEALLGERCMVITSGALARRDAIMEVGLFDESLRNSQDFDLWVRLARRENARMNFQRRVLLRHRAHQGSLASDAIRSVEGELKVLRRVREWPDLTEAERRAMESTIALREASIEVDKGKRSLVHGDYDAATKSFRFANEYYRSWKLAIVLAGMRVAPALVSGLYKRRRA
ncbi:MAG TPA: glycosyltransferase family A protein [Pyrinomonadaceae bacterium]|nr:glycosyltransferase family A protein [Pyrinomonadaceae bacterium]